MGFSPQADKASKGVFLSLAFFQGRLWIERFIGDIQDGRSSPQDRLRHHCQARFALLLGCLLGCLSCKPEPEAKSNMAPNAKHLHSAAGQYMRRIPPSQFSRCCLARRGSFDSARPNRSHYLNKDRRMDVPACSLLNARLQGPEAKHPETDVMPTVLFAFFGVGPTNFSTLSWDVPVGGTRIPIKDS